MAILLAPQIGAYAYAAGVREQRALATAIAVAMAESGGNTRAHNATPPDDSYGLWQINMLGSLGPARRAQFGISTNDALYDPAVNARAMGQISAGGTNWRPWTTYGGLRYRAAYPAAYAAATAVRAARGASESIGDAGEAITDATGIDTIGAIADYAGAVKDWISDRHNWVRLVWGLAGVNLVMLGIILAVKDTDAVKAVISRGVGASA